MSTCNMQHSGSLGLGVVRHHARRGRERARSSPHGLFFLFCYFVTMSCTLETERKGWARGAKRTQKSQRANQGGPSRRAPAPFSARQGTGWLRTGGRNRLYPEGCCLGYHLHAPKKQAPWTAQEQDGVPAFTWDGGKPQGGSAQGSLRSFSRT